MSSTAITRKVIFHATLRIVTASCRGQADTATVLSHNWCDTDAKPGLEYRQPNLGGGDERARSLPRDGVLVPPRRRASSRGQLEAARRSREMAPQSARPDRFPLRGVQRLSSRASPFGRVKRRRWKADVLDAVPPNIGAV